MQINMQLPCPCCGRPYPPRLVVSGHIRQRIVNIVASRPDGIPTADLHSLVYAHCPNGGPSLRNIAAVVHYANKQLRPQGYEIYPTSRGRGARYALRVFNAAVAAPTPTVRTLDHLRLEGPEPAITPRQH
jgi:hypothetical protein